LLARTPSTVHARTSAPSWCLSSYRCLFFFFNDTATTEIYTLFLHDALPIFDMDGHGGHDDVAWDSDGDGRSEEHTSELQSHLNLVCRLLLEKKKKKQM